MTTPDLITRLRGWPNLPGLNLDKDLMNEAADELERLRAQQSQQDGAITWATEGVQQIIAERDALKAEVERLRAAFVEAVNRAAASNPPAQGVGEAQMRRALITIRDTLPHIGGAERSIHALLEVARAALAQAQKEQQ